MCAHVRDGGVADPILVLPDGLIDTIVALLAPVWMGSSPFFVLIFYWSFRRQPVALFEAARLEGLGPLRIWASIAMPLARPATAAVALLTFVQYWSDFMNPLLYLKSDDRTTLALGLRVLQQLDATNWPLLMAGAVVMMLPVLLLLLVLQRAFWSAAGGEAGPASARGGMMPLFHRRCRSRAPQLGGRGRLAPAAAAAHAPAARICHVFGDTPRRPPTSGWWGLHLTTPRSRSRSSTSPARATTASARRRLRSRHPAVSFSSTTAGGAFAAGRPRAARRLPRAQPLIPRPFFARP